MSRVSGAFVQGPTLQGCSAGESLATDWSVRDLNPIFTVLLVLKRNSGLSCCVIHKSSCTFAFTFKLLLLQMYCSSSARKIVIIKLFNRPDDRLVRPINRLIDRQEIIIFAGPVGSRKPQPILLCYKKPNILLYSPYYAEACIEFAVLISAS